MEDRRRQVEEFTHEWAIAEQRGDAAFLEDALTDDFLGVGPPGFMLHKERWLGRFVGGLSYKSFTLVEMETRFYEGTAVATRRQSQTGEYQGHDVRGSSARPWSSWSSRGVGCWPAFT